MAEDYRDLHDRGFGEQRLRERRELEEQEQAFARAKRQRLREEQREQYSALDQLRDELRAEIADVRQDVEARYETLIKASGEALGDSINDMHDAIKKIETELFGLVERRFGELMGRLDVILPERPRRRISNLPVSASATMR
jgi:DNA anti-recombination protein RmuC